MSDLLSGLTVPILGRAKRAAREPQAAAPHGTTAGAAKHNVREPAAKGVSPAAVNPLANYTPRARVKYLHAQHCDCCGRVTEYIAADLLEYAAKDRVGGISAIRTRAWQAPDAQFSGLPIRLEYLTPDRVSACAECLRLERAFTLAAEGRGQLPLAFDSGGCTPTLQSTLHATPAATAAAVAHKAHILPAGSVRAARAHKALIVPLGDSVAGPRD